MRDNQQDQINDLAKQVTRMAGLLADALEHTQAIKDMQFLVFYGLIEKHPDLKDYFSTAIKHLLDSPDVAIGDRTIDVLKQMDSYIRGSVPPSKKDRFRPYLVKPSSPAPTPDPTVDDNQ